MPRVTIASLKEELNQAHEIIHKQLDDISKLNKELDDTRNSQGMVSQIEYDMLLRQYEALEDMYNQLNKLYEKEKPKKKTSAGLENENWNLRCENDSLKKKIVRLEKESAEIKTVHNARGAGRKIFDDVDTVKRIFRYYADGQSLQKIADILNQDGILTKAGGTWSKSSVRFILKNHAYVENGTIDEELYSLITARTN